jgi:hypothetical protein
MGDVSQMFTVIGSCVSECILLIQSQITAHFLKNDFVQQKLDRLHTEKDHQY